jgi:hypothetical protein
MRTFFKIALFAGFAAFTSCGEVDSVSFDGTDTGANTLLAFSRNTYSLPIERDLTGSLVVTLNASTLSDTDRTYAVEVIPNTGLLGADPATYSVPVQSITIPAGEYQGTLNIYGADGGLVDEQTKNFSIRLAESSLHGENMDSNFAVVNVFEVCALQSPFLGNYQLEQVTSSGFEGETIIQDGLVKLVEGDTPYERKFNALIWPAYNTTPVTFNIVFKCDFLNIDSLLDAGVGCDDEGGGIFVGPGATPESYDTTNDSEFFITVTNDKKNSCNGREQILLRLTKVE